MKGKVIPFDGKSWVFTAMLMIACPPNCAIRPATARIRKLSSSSSRSEEHTSELQSLMRTSYAVFCLTKINTTHINSQYRHKHRTIQTTTHNPSHNNTP